MKNLLTICIVLQILAVSAFLRLPNKYPTGAQLSRSACSSRRPQPNQVCALRMGNHEDSTVEKKSPADEVFDRKNIEHLFAANRKWAEDMKAKDKDFFKRQTAGQFPKYLWIGCSDARVPANEVVGLQPGEIYVHRNIANLVVNTDFNVLSVLQFAVEFLEVEHVIVCGHYQCGGIAAALELTDHTSPLENWVRNIRDVARLHQDEIFAIGDLKARQRRLAELNVIEQCINVYKLAVVQRRRVFTHVKEGFANPRIHGVIYDPATGELKLLNWNPKDYIDRLQEVYKLYDVEESMQGYNGEPYEKRSGTPWKKSLYNRRPF